MKALRIVATKLADYDPAALAFERVRGVESEADILDMLIELPLAGATKARVMLKTKDAGERCLLTCDVPDCTEDGDGARLEAASELSEFLMDYCADEQVQLVHAHSWNLYALVNRSCAHVERAGLVSMRGLDIARGAMVQCVYRDRLQGPNVEIHYPSREIAKTAKLLNVARDGYFVPNGARCGALAPSINTGAERFRVVIPGNVDDTRNLKPCLVGLNACLSGDDEIVRVGGLSDIDAEALRAELDLRVGFEVTGPLAHSRLLSALALGAVAVCPGGREGGQSSIFECIGQGLPTLVEVNETNLELFGADAVFLYRSTNELGALVRRVKEDGAFASTLKTTQREIISGRLGAGAEHDRFLDIYRTLAGRVG